MTEQNTSPASESLEDWVLQQLPGMTYVCENDEFYTMRFLCAGGGYTFGYDLKDFVNNQHYFAASVIHPDDLDIVDEHADTLVRRRGNCVSRYRLVRADGTVIPVLVVTRAVRDNEGNAINFVGYVRDLTDVPTLDGPYKVLTDASIPGIPGDDVIGQRPEHYDAAWMLKHLPVVVYANLDDADYTPIFLSERMRHELGYDAAEFQEKSACKVSSIIPPEEQDISDRAVELAAANENLIVASRLRPVRADNSDAQTVCFSRGATHQSGRGIVGVAVYVHDVPELQGPSCILHGEGPRQ